jgi:UDP-N-acetylmuramate dehydrogenase
LRGELRFAEPLAAYTSWRVGGPARRFYKAADLSDLCVFLQGLPADEPLFWLGLGSNLLVRDRGIPGTVIATHGALQQLALTGPQTLRVEVGVPCAKVARFSATHSLGGAEFLAGIPGLMGGALAMNAGAWGDETWSRVEMVETVDRYGHIHRRMPADYRIGYRTVQGMLEEWFVAAHLRLTASDGQLVRARVRHLLAQRAQTQPIGAASCGSVFRNPPGDYAARLIETAGLKGTCIGAACVSTKHANFIINMGGATAADLEALIDSIKDSVFKKHGVTLIPEVQIVGEQS